MLHRNLYVIREGGAFILIDFLKTDKKIKTGLLNLKKRKKRMTKITIIFCAQ